MIATAQEQLNITSDPKPLPAAALFKAYDEVLPQHGIDPDSDHHLSTLVFRVGGEQGDGTLLQKFQAILARMGIVLEFRNTSVSLSSSSPPSISSDPPNVDDSGVDRTKGPRSQGLPRYAANSSSAPASLVLPPVVLDADIEVSANGFVAAKTAELLSAVDGWKYVATRKQLSSRSNDTLPQPSHNSQIDVIALEGPHLDTANSIQFHPVYINLSDQSITRRATLDAGIDQWRNELSKPQKRETDDKMWSDQGQLRNAPIRHQPQSNAPQIDTRPHTGTGASRAGSTDVEKLDNGLAKGDGLFAMSNKALVKLSPVASIANSTLFAPPRTFNLSSVSAGKMQDDEQLLTRASRARQIYLASRVFNHWADRTAVRLEREGVARRHMLRFRCFRGWSQIPSSRTPVIDQLRTITAVQKLQRAIAYQDEQLGVAASAIALGYRLKNAATICAIWLCCQMVQVARRRKAYLNISNTTRRWVSQLNEHVTMALATRGLRQHYARMDMLRRWRGQAQKGARRFVAAQMTGLSRVALSYLEEWAMQTEAKQIAALYCQHVLIEKATTIQCQWNLRARAHAFTGRNEYLTVIHAVDKWSQSTTVDNHKIQLTKHCYTKQRTFDVLYLFSQFKVTLSKLSGLSSRARLYIVAMHTLRVLDTAVERRKGETKETLRRHLMIRYTQVSSARKKRTFFLALNRWKATAAQSSSNETFAIRAKASDDRQQQHAAIIMWMRKMQQGLLVQVSARQYFAQVYVEAWGAQSAEEEQQGLYAWELWTSGMQHQCLKRWTISALQRSGQGHAANMAKQRYNNDKRSRALQYWRQISGNTRNLRASHDQWRTPIQTQRRVFRSGLRALSTQRHLSKRSLDEQDYRAKITETPTRWTGLPLAMSIALPSKAMVSVKDKGGGSSPFSSIDKENHPLKSTSTVQISGMSLADLPSTTPQASLPSDLELEPLSVNNPASRGLSRGPAGKTVHAKALAQDSPRLFLRSTSRLRLDNPRADNESRVARYRNIDANGRIPSERVGQQ